MVAHRTDFNPIADDDKLIFLCPVSGGIIERVFSHSIPLFVFLLSGRMALAEIAQTAIDYIDSLPACHLYGDGRFYFNLKNVFLS